MQPGVGMTAVDLRAELRPGDLTVVVDTREQMPFDLRVQTADGPVEIPSIRAGLVTGDYSVVGFESEIVVERKSLDDLIGCIGAGRKRFDAECQRLLAYRSRCIVVEASMAMLAAGHWRSQVTPAAAIGSVVGWIEMGIPIVFPGNRTEAALFTARFLYTATRRRYERLYRGFISRRAKGGSDEGPVRDQAGGEAPAREADRGAGPGDPGAPLAAPGREADRG